MDLLDVVALLAVEVRLQGQVGHADDRVHGCPNLVAHVGQEVALDLGRLLGRLLGAQVLLLHTLSLGDVQQPAHDAGFPEVRVGDEGGQEVAPLAARRKQLDLAIADQALALHRVEQVHPVFRPDIDLLGQVPGASAEHPFKLRVDVSEGGVGREGDAHGGLVEDALKRGLLLGQGPLCFVALGDVPHRGAVADVAPTERRQPGQAHLDRERLAVAASPLHLATLTRCEPGPANLARAGLLADCRFRNQGVEGQTDQGPAVMAEHVFRLGIGQDHDAAAVQHQHAVGRRLDDPAVPGLGGPDLGLLSLELDGLLLQARRLALHVFRLVPRLLQQLLVPDAAVEDLQAHRQDGHGPVQQGLHVLAEAFEDGQFDRTQQPLFAQDGEGQDGLRRRRPQGRGDVDVVVGRLGEKDRGALQRALPDQPLPELQGLVEALALAKGVGAQQPEALLALVVHVEDPVTHLQEGRDLGEEPLRQLAVAVRPLHLGRDLGQVRLDPALALRLPGAGLEHADGSRQRANLVRVPGMRDHLVELTGCQLLDHVRQAFERPLDGHADDEPQTKAEAEAPDQEQEGHPVAALRDLLGVGRGGASPFLDIRGELVQRTDRLQRADLEFAPGDEVRQLGLLAVALELDGEVHVLPEGGELPLEIPQQLERLLGAGPFADFSDRRFDARVCVRQHLQRLRALRRVLRQGRLAQGAPDLDQVCLRLFDVGNREQVPVVKLLDPAIQVVQVPQAEDADDQGQRQHREEAHRQFPGHPTTFERGQQSIHHGFSVASALAGFRLVKGGQACPVLASSCSFFAANSWSRSWKRAATSLNSSRTSRNASTISGSK